MSVQWFTDLYSTIRDNGDPRTEGMFLIKEPLYILGLIIGYLFIVIKGPQFMLKRDGLELRKPLIVYNFFLVALSAWMMYEVGMVGAEGLLISGGLLISTKTLPLSSQDLYKEFLLFVTTFLNPATNVWCEPTNHQDVSEMRLRQFNVLWWYFFSKIIEFMDTFFFILRKKNRQITFLHVYHHCSILMLEWIATKYVPGSQSCLPAMLNSFIHVLMYSYYMLAAFGPHMQKYLWWKRYLTKMQIIQFLIVFLHTSYAIKMDCGFPKGFLWLLWSYMLTLFMLFSHFYTQAYSTKPKEKKVD